MSSLRIDRFDATLGARISGVSLARLDDVDWQAIETGFAEHAVLVFPGQHLDAAQQIAFGNRWGRLSIETMSFSNLDEHGGVLGAEADMVRLLRGNEGWHTDHSFTPVSAKASILSAQVVPQHGGETEWADMRAAYSALDQATKARLTGLAAHHSLYHSQAQAGQDRAGTWRALQALGGRASAAADARAPRPLRPLVKIHPDTNRPALFIGRHAHDIPGLSADESAALLSELLEFACQHPRVIQHRWHPGDVVIWDNRCVLHRARPYDPTEPRVMVHTRVAGNPTSESAELR